MNELLVSESKVVYALQTNAYKAGVTHRIFAKYGAQCFGHPPGQTALLIGAVFGSAAVHNPAFVGVGLSLLDTGTSFDNLCTLAMNLAGVTKPEDVVRLLYTNVVGAAPSADQAAPFVAMLNQGTTVGELTKMAAELELTAIKVDLAGLAQTGLEFVVS